MHDKRAPAALRRRAGWLALSAWLCLAFAQSAWAAALIEPLDFDDDALEARYLRLVRELRCPKCQNQNLYTSDAPLAADLRGELKRMLNAGDGDDEIVRFMTARYGEFVRYRPGLSAATVSVWLAPGILLLFGAVLAWRRLAMREGASALERAEPPAAAARPEPAWARRAAWAWIPLALALAAALYWRLGAWPDVRLAEQLRAGDWRAAAPMLERRARERPEDVNALSLLGSAYAHLRRPEDAVRAWRDALSLAPANGQAAAQLKMGIAAMSRLAAGPEAVALDIDLRLAASLSVPKGLPVYVFARSVGESAAPMPLAVVRLASERLPARVTLSDRNAMLPSLRLSSAERVQLTARVSRDGDATASPGDWQGVSEVLSLDGRRQRVELVIDTQLPGEAPGL